MTTVRELHREAMRLSMDAHVARDCGDLDTFRALTTQALPLEAEAAGKIAKEIASEPTRSILYLSAASLAYQLGDWDRSLELITEGLSGWPPPRTIFGLMELKDAVEREKKGAG